jgi:hypothetical protein
VKLSHFGAALMKAEASASNPAVNGVGLGRLYRGEKFLVCRPPSKACQLVLLLRGLQPAILEIVIGSGVIISTSIA